MNHRCKSSQRQRKSKNGGGYVVIGNSRKNRWGTAGIRHEGSKAMRNRLSPGDVEQPANL